LSQTLRDRDDHWPLLRRMIVEGQAPGALVSDAQIATLTMEYGGTLQTTDRDFARFEVCDGKIRWSEVTAVVLPAEKFGGARFPL
jgi:predicted nucleic acid-binding protein